MHEEKTKVFLIKGVLKKHRAVGGLLGTLRGSKFLQHLEGGVEVIPKEDGYHVSFRVREYDTRTTEQALLLHNFPELKENSIS